MTPERQRAQAEFSTNGHTRNGDAKQKSFDEVARLEELVGNVLCSRDDLFRRLCGSRTDVDSECDYPSTATVELYRTLFDRDPIGKRVVELLPKESWQMSPLVYEDESSEDATPFEQAWDDLGKQLSGGSSWYKDEQGSTVWEYLLRADILSGIGSFGIILLSIDDGRNLQDPVDGIELLTNGKGDSPITNEERELIQEYDVHGKVRVKDKEGNITSNAANSKPIQTYVNSPQTSTRPAPPISNDSSGWAPTKSVFGSPFVPGTDQQYSDFGIGQVKPMAYGGASPLGTDQQYFSVQFGPSEQLPTPSKRQHKLQFMRCFDESLVQVVRYEWNINNPRFGQPVMYRVTLNDPRQQQSGVGLSLATVYVHWSRVLHIADNLTSSEIFGTPRMQACLNAILDIKKVRGGSAQMYWAGAFPGLSIETNPQLGGDVEVDVTATQTQIQDYYSSLRRALVLMGMTAKSLAPQVSDPTAQIAVQTESICIAIGCPVRVFKGSERGEQASSQDDSKWNDRLRHRQLFYITPRIIVGLIDRLIMLGVLPEPQRAPMNAVQAGSDVAKKTAARKQRDALKKQQQTTPDPSGDPSQQLDEEGQPAPVDESQDQSTTFPAQNQRMPRGWRVENRVRYIKTYTYNADTGEEEDGPPKQVQSTVVSTPGGYSIEWPDLDSTSKQVRSSIATANTASLAQFIQGGIENLMAPADFLTKVMYFSEEEAAAILENAHSHLEDVNPEVDDSEVVAGHGVVTPAPEPPPPAPMTQVQPGYSLADPETGEIISTAPGKASMIVPPISIRGGGGPPQFGGGKKPPGQSQQQQVGSEQAAKPNQNKQNANPNHDERGRFSSVSGGKAARDSVHKQGEEFEHQQKPANEQGRGKQSIIGDTSVGVEAAHKAYFDKSNAFYRMASKLRDEEKNVVEKISHKVSDKFHSMEARYGHNGAIAVMAGMAVALPIPIPGTMLVPIGIAEGVRALDHAVHGKAKSNPAVVNFFNDLLLNSWSDQAREAALAARQAGRLKESNKALKASEKARERGTSEAHIKAGQRHETAAEAYDRKIQKLNQPKSPLITEEYEQTLRYRLERAATAHRFTALGHFHRARNPLEFSHNITSEEWNDGKNAADNGHSSPDLDTLTKEALDFITKLAQQYREPVPQVDENQLREAIQQQLEARHEAVDNANPNHDKLGRFSSSSTGSEVVLPSSMIVPKSEPIPSFRLSGDGKLHLSDLEQSDFSAELDNDEPMPDPNIDTTGWVPTKALSREGSALQTASSTFKKRLGGGANDSFIVTLEDGTKGVWKPAKGEAYLRPNIDPGTYYRREAAASSVAHVIGLDDLVPLTVERMVNGEIGSFQKFIPKAENANEVAYSKMFDGANDLARAAAFDALVYNTDRHTGNWMLTGLGPKSNGVNSGEGHLELIDNGLAFPTDQAHFKSFLYDAAVAHELRVPEEVADWNMRDIRKVLEAHKIEEDAIAGVESRLAKLKKAAISGAYFSQRGLI